VYDFGMNTVCAAGTGSCLDQQACRPNLPVEEIGPLALQPGSPVRIAGRCTVSAESDMIHDWDDISGEMMQRAPQPLIHGYVWCTDVQGEIAHLHAHGDSAHWIKGLRCQEGQQPKNRFDNSFRI